MTEESKTKLREKILRSKELTAMEKRYLEEQVNASDWIPCSERMPKKGGNYLCISNNEYKILPYRNGEFYCVCFDSVLRCCNSSVTHWMPLPQTPKLT